MAVGVRRGGRRRGRRCRRGRWVGGKSAGPGGERRRLNGPAAALEGAEADAAVADAARQRTTRDELARLAGFEQVSPGAGSLDEEAFVELLETDGDEALALLASMSSAMDRELRERARRLAGRLMLDVARRGALTRRRPGRIAPVRWRPDGGGDLDLDASLDAVAAARAAGTAVDVDDLRVSEWSRPDTALALLVDRSGSMGGRPLATSAVAAAAVAWRNPADYSVVSFARRPVVVKGQSATRSVEQVVAAVLALRGHGTTDLAAALVAAGQQLARSGAGRRVAVLLSDCRATEPGDAVAAAAALDELVIAAPAGDEEAARAFADATGSRIAIVTGPTSVPAAFAALLS